MLPQVFKTISVPSVKDIVGIQIYDFDSVPEGITAPYISWLFAQGLPHGNISDAPGGDSYMVQIDCYAGPSEDGRDEVEALWLAVRDALDAALISNRMVIATRERDTKLFRISIEADFISQR